LHQVIKNNTWLEQTDDALLKLFRETLNQQVLATLYLRYTDLVYGTALKYLSDAEAAKDASIDIYQELVDKIPSHEVSHFKGWLYTLVKNHCLQKIRKQKRAVMVSMDIEFMQLGSFEHLDTVLEKENEFQKLELCVKKLPAKQKTSIELFYFQKKCYEEIADILSEDWNKVRSLIQNGRRNLKICMEKPAQ
jgi:RNA polymerase sigma-70 factor (ECF subfamily)